MFLALLQVRTLFDSVEQLYGKEPPEIILSKKPFLAGSEHSSFPSVLHYAEKDHLDALTLNEKKVSRVMKVINLIGLPFVFRVTYLITTPD